MKQEPEPEVPTKHPKRFQTLKLSAQSSSTAVPTTQKPAVEVAVGPTTPKPKPMPSTGKRGDALRTYSAHVRSIIVMSSPHRAPVLGMWLHLLALRPKDGEADRAVRLRP